METNPAAANGGRPAPSKDEWEEHADTTLAHNRGSLGNAQLEAENRELPKGMPRTVRPGGKIERAQAPPAPERATGGPQADPPVTAASDDLSALTVPELKERAKERGIEGYSTMLKADLIQALATAATGG